MKDAFSFKGAGTRHFHKMDKTVIEGLSHNGGKTISVTMTSLSRYLMDIGLDYFINLEIDDKMNLDEAGLRALARQIRGIYDEAQADYFQYEESLAEAQDYQTDERIAVLMRHGLTHISALKYIRETDLAAQRANAGPPLSPTMETINDPAESEEAKLPEQSPWNPPENAEDDVLEMETITQGATSSAMHEMNIAPSEVRPRSRLRPSFKPHAPEDSTYGGPRFTNRTSRRSYHATPMRSNLTTPVNRALDYDTHHSQSPFDEVSGEPRKEPKWVTACLINDQSTPFSFQEATPFKVMQKTSRKPEDNAKLTESQKRMNIEMQRVSAIVVKDNNTWFVSYDANDPLNCIPESAADIEKRIFVWHLLCRIFKSNAGAFVAVLKYDVKAMCLVAWQTLYNTPMSADDDEFLAYRSAKLNPSEKFDVFLCRLDEMARLLNEKGLHTVSEQAYMVHIFGILKRSGTWWTNLVYQAELHGWSMSEVKSKFTFMSANASISEQAHSATQKQPQANEVKALQARIKVLEAASKETAKAAVQLSATGTFPPQLQNKLRKDLPPGACWQFWRFAGCIKGSACTFIHDPALGPPSNTKIPTWYQCFWCKAEFAHWSSKCSSPAALKNKKNRGDAAVAKEVKRAEGKGGEGRGGKGGPSARPPSQPTN